MSVPNYANYVAGRYVMEAVALFSTREKEVDQAIRNLGALKWFSLMPPANLPIKND